VHPMVFIVPNALERRWQVATKYHVCGVIEVDVVAENAEAALDLAETRIYRVLDRSAKKLNAAIGLDIVKVDDEIVWDAVTGAVENY